jgi:hypothetical protein
VRDLGSDPALVAFAGLAEAFCTRLDDAGSRPEELLDAVHRLLPQLYAGALLLPPTSLLYDDDGESSERYGDAPPGEVEHRPAAGLPRLSELLGERTYYREVFNPYADVSEEEVTGDILDDLDDIYRDLRRGLLHWRAGQAGHALWHWRFHFEIHWGEHATSALRALFALSAFRGMPWPEGSGTPSLKT